MDVMTPDMRPNWSAPGEFGRSIDATDDTLVCRDDRDPTELALSRSAPRYAASSYLLSPLSFLPLEKKDFPPDDCRDLLSADDMIGYTVVAEQMSALV